MPNITPNTIRRPISPAELAAISKASNMRSTINPTMTYGTNGLSYYLPNKFMLDSIEQSVTLSRCRTEYRVPVKGEIDKMAIARHIMQGKTEGEAVNSTGVSVSKVPYALEYVSSLYEVTRELIDANIAGEDIARNIFTLHAQQYGADLGDLAMNGNEAYTYTDDPGASEDEKAFNLAESKFYKINNGFVVQAEATGNKLEDTVKLSWDVLFDLNEAIPSRYKNQNFCWIMSPKMWSEWHRYVVNSANSGGTLPAMIERPLNYEIIKEPYMPEGKIMLVDPMNLIHVTNYQPVFRMTTEGKDAIQRNVDYHAIHSAHDFIIAEPNALAIATSVQSSVAKS